MTSHDNNTSAAPSHPLRVLLVENDPDDTRIIREMLSGRPDLPTSLEVTGSVAAAVERLSAEPAEVVLLDLKLADGQGRDNLDRILRVAGTAAILIMTDVESRPVAEELLELGAQDLLVKGHHDADALIRTIRFARRRRTLLAQVEHLTEESRQHQAELPTILDGAPLPMILIDHERRVQLVNGAARDLINREPTSDRTRLGEALGCVVCISNPDGCGQSPECQSCTLRETVTDTLETGRPHRNVEAELQLAGPSARGSSWFRIATSRVTPADEPMVLVSVEDITEHRRTGHRVRTLNRLLNTMLEIDELAVRETDPQAVMDGASRVLVESGDFAVAWFAIADADGRLRCPASCGIDPEWLRSLEAQVEAVDGPGYATAEAVRTGHTVRIDDVATDHCLAPWRDELVDRGIASGVAIPLQVSGTVAGALTVCAAEPWRFEPETVKLIERLAGTIAFALSNIEQERARRDAEIDLRSSELRYRALFERNPAGVYRTTADGRFLATNPALVEMLGFDSEDQLLNLPVASIYAHTSDRDTFLATLLTDGVVENFEVELRRYDGSSAWVLLNAGLIEAEDGTRLIEGTAIDISQRREVVEQMLHSQRLEAVGRLAGGVAHDFNNLLQAVTTQVRTLGAMRGDASIFETRLGEIEDLVWRGAQLTRQLLIFARRETTRPEILDLSDVAHAAGTLLRRMVRDDVELTIDAAKTELPVLADRSQLEQVVLNLSLNAQDAMPEGGQLTVRTRNAGGKATLEVEDSGHGIPANILDQVFEPFFTTKPAATGTGLGLSVARGIVERAGGQIELRPRAGGGTQACVTLPLVAATEIADRTARREQPALRDGGHVLLVEDEDGVREGLAEALRTVGYLVTTAADVSTARLTLDGGTFDAVLSDMVLPDGSGVELIRHVRAGHPDSGCILMSGYASDAIDTIDTDIGPGMVFLQKPFGLNRLTDALHQVISAARGRSDDSHQR
jgi:PAS domain S-box-containing protein